MLRNPLIPLMTGIGLLLAGLGIHAEAASNKEQLHASLSHDVVQTSQSISSSFERARSIDLMLAQTKLTDDTGHFDRARVTKVYKYLEDVLYPGVISEACLIDDRGHELSRVTRGVPAPADELSDDEADAPFFAPTLKLKQHQVFQSAPYLSPDTHTWVLATTTWIPSSQGRLIVHFELLLDSLRPYVTQLPPHRHAGIVDGRTGRIVLSSDTSLVVPRVKGNEEPTPQNSFPTAPWARSVTTWNRSPNAFEVDGQPAHFQAMDLGPTSENHWYVVQWSTQPRTFVQQSTGWLLGSLGVILILLGLALARRQQRHLRRIAAHDSLTGILNRRGLETRITDGLARRADGMVCVLVMDLDGFKLINDTHGHHRGDDVLREIATRLRDNTLEQDCTGRLGGDEFAVLLTSIRNPQDALTVAHRLRDALIRPMVVDGVERYVGVSIGIAISPGHGTTSEELLRNADAAMYEVKRSQGGVKIYEPGSQEQSDMLGTAARLLNAINACEITLAFQPLYSLADGSICGAEALARWQYTVVDENGQEQTVHESPGMFIPLAERTGLIRSLTHLTLRKALDEAQSWHRAGHALPVSVNLSAKLVNDDTLVRFVTTELEARDLPASALILEITETAAVAQGDGTWPVLQELRDLGIRIQLDDFGAGHASFGVLRQLPLDGVKIDRELLADQLRTEPHLLAATVRMAQRFNLEITAEGIEDEESLALSRQIGSHVGQGYHLARPMPASQFHDLLGQRPTGPVVPPQGNPDNLTRAAQS